MLLFFSLLRCGVVVTERRRGEAAAPPRLSGLEDVSNLQPRCVRLRFSCWPKIEQHSAKVASGRKWKVRCKDPPHKWRRRISQALPETNSIGNVSAGGASVEKQPVVWDRWKGLFRDNNVANYFGDFFFSVRSIKFCKRQHVQQWASHCVFCLPRNGDCRRHHQDVWLQLWRTLLITAYCERRLLISLLATTL